MHDLPIFFSNLPAIKFYAAGINRFDYFVVVIFDVVLVIISSWKVSDVRTSGCCLVGTSELAVFIVGRQAAAAAAVSDDRSAVSGDVRTIYLATKLSLAKVTTCRSKPHPRRVII